MQADITANAAAASTANIAPRRRSSAMRGGGVGSVMARRRAAGRCYTFADRRGWRGRHHKGVHRGERGDAWRPVQKMTPLRLAVAGSMATVGISAIYLIGW